MIWKTTVALFLTLLRNRHARRRMMLHFSLGTMLYTIVGITLIGDFLGDHLIVFSIYWFFCLALVVLMLLMSVYDFAATKGGMSHKSSQDLNNILKGLRHNIRDENEESEER